MNNHALQRSACKAERDPRQRDGKQRTIGLTAGLARVASAAALAGLAGAAQVSLAAGGASPLLSAPAGIPIEGPALTCVPASEQQRGLPLLTIPDAYDALHYDLAIEIDLDEERIDGTLTLTARVLARDLDRVDLDLEHDLQVSSVLVDGSPAPFGHQRDVIRIPLALPLSSGEEFQVTVVYGGHPVPQGFGSFLFEEHGGVPIVQTFSQPTFAHTWWPCKDRPDDKATMDLRVTVPDWMVVGSNGVLAGVDRSDRGGKPRATWHWSERSPIATYLVSIAATNYVRIEDTYVSAVSGGVTMPITHYVFPEDAAAAAIDFEGVPEMIGFFAGRFGEYPFLDEKYGMAEFRHTGAMEHQTLTSYSSGFIQGTHQYDTLVAHELAHQWWGNCVTLQDYRHMWLNEGFATYSEALWQEEVAGRQAYLQFFADRDYPFPGTLFDPISIFSFVNYLKGAWVLHMLRGVIGDSLFFDALRSHLASHAYGNATSWSFQRVVESVTGEDLGWFFDEWVLDEGRPVYELRWSHAGGETPQGTPLEVRIDQVQDGRVFTMPLPLWIHGPGGVIETSVWNDRREATYTFWTDAPVDSVRLDPEGWVLKWIGSPPGSAGPDVASGIHSPAPGPGLHDRSSPPAVAIASPNPFRASTEIRLAAPSRGAFRVEVFDIRGRLLLRESSAGEDDPITFRWAGTDGSGRPLPAGTYFYRVEGNEGAVTGSVVFSP